MMLTGEKVQIQRHRWPEEGKKCAEKEEEGAEKKQMEKEGVSYETGGFSTRFVFLLLYFVVHLSCLTFFSSLVQHQKHHISVIFNITPKHVYMFRKLGVFASA